MGVGAVTGTVSGSPKTTNWQCRIAPRVFSLSHRLPTPCHISAGQQVPHLRQTHMCTPPTASRSLHGCDPPAPPHQSRQTLCPEGQREALRWPRSKKKTNLHDLHTLPAGIHLTHEKRSSSAGYMHQLFMSTAALVADGHRFPTSLRTPSRVSCLPFSHRLVLSVARQRAPITSCQPLQMIRHECSNTLCSKLVKGLGWPQTAPHTQATLRKRTPHPGACPCDVRISRDLSLRPGAAHPVLHACEGLCCKQICAQSCA